MEEEDTECEIRREKTGWVGRGGKVNRSEESVGGQRWRSKQ